MHLEHLQLFRRLFIPIFGFSKSLSKFQISLFSSSKSKFRLNLFSNSIKQKKKFNLIYLILFCDIRLYYNNNLKN